jgi:hypothetical protein
MEDSRWARVCIGLFGVWFCFGLSRKGILAIMSEHTTGHKARGVITGGDAVFYGWILLSFGVVIGIIGLGCCTCHTKKKGTDTLGKTGVKQSPCVRCILRTYP